MTDDDPRWRQSAFGYGCNAAEKMDPSPRSLAPQKRMTASRSAPVRVQPNISVVRGRLLVANGRLPLGSSRGKPPDHGQFAAVLALVKDKPSAALKSAVLDRSCARRQFKYAVGIFLSIRLQIWGPEVRILPGAPAKSNT